MPVPRVHRWEKVPAEKTTPHHVPPVADKPRHPIQVLAGTQAELKLDVVEEVKHVPVKDPRIPTGRRDQIVEVPSLDLGDRWRATPLPFGATRAR